MTFIACGEGDKKKIDVTKPIITLNGSAIVTLIEGNSYLELGAMAYDDIDGNITKAINVENAIDTTVIGSYSVTYNVKDSNNNKAIQVIRTVLVLPLTNRTNAKEVLILYDKVDSTRDTGKNHAILLENLLGHFDLNVKSKPAVDYVSNDMENAKTVFYIGSAYDILKSYDEGSVEKQAYQNFYTDVATKNKNIVWINYNLASLEKFWTDNNLDNQSFAQKFAISSDFISPSKYNRVEYKNTELFKGVIPFATPGANLSTCIAEGNNRYACATELNLIKIVDINKSKVFATAYSSIDKVNIPSVPYITRGGNFWFVGDIPFSYMSEEDRYLAFADILHDMLNIPHKESHKAIMRLEDVDAKTNINKFNEIATFMKNRNIPFSVATIARYEDPLGFENSVVS